jgi:hypothetical protein
MKPRRLCNVRLRIVVWLILVALVQACTAVATEAPNPAPASPASPAPTASPPRTATLVPTLTATPVPPPVVQLAWFYRPPADHDLVALARHYSTFILTYSDESVRDQLKTMGVSGPFLQYMTLNAIQDPGGCNSQPYHSQAAYHVGDFCDISLNHADWFSLDKTGSRIPEGYDPGYWLMDPSNIRWQKFWLDRVQTTQESFGWDGVFLDFAEASLGLRQRVGPLPVNFADDASWRAANIGFVKYLYTSYFHPNHRPLFVNIGEVRDLAGWQSFLPFLDGFMNEGWAVGWHAGEYKTPADWEQDLSQAETVQAAGKRIILVAQGPADDLTRQQFAYGSYLLVADGRASFRYASGAAYNQDVIYDDYQSDLGRPLGPRIKTGDTWQREFEHGRVTVAPLTHRASIDLK